MKFYLQEEVGAVVGGKVLPLPSDELREERAEGRNQMLANDVSREQRQLNMDK